MTPEQLEPLKYALQDLIGSYVYFGLGLIAIFMFKGVMANIGAGLMIFMGNDFNEDDVVFVNSRKARIIRVGIRKTVFYMADLGTKMVIPNDRLKYLTIEKKLPNNKLIDEDNEK